MTKTAIGWGREWALTQRVVVLCPEGHKIGVVSSDMGARVGASAHWQFSFEPEVGEATLTRRGTRLTYTCRACRLAGARSFRGEVRLAPVAELLAAMHVYGPRPALRVRLTRSGLRNQIAECIEGGKRRLGVERELPEPRALRRARFVDLMAP